MFVTYAQNFEDVMLWRALKTVENGFYIDIGANHPIVESVSCAFYQAGWRGINVEPVPRLIKLLEESRPDEVNIQACVGEEVGDVPFFLSTSEGMSTAHGATIESHIAANFQGETIPMKTISLDSLFKQAGDRDIHWLKIDAEGSEEEIVKSWGKNKTRPWVLVVESTVPGSQKPNHAGFDPLLVKMGYEFVYFDGVNRFYVHEKHAELKANFSHPPCIFDKFTLAETNHSFGKALIEKNNEYLRFINVRNNELTSLMNTVTILKTISKNLDANIEVVNNTIQNRQRLRK